MSEETILIFRYFPENADLHTTLGLLYMQIGKYQQAFEHLGTTLTFEPTNTRAILAAGSMMQVQYVPFTVWLICLASEVPIDSLCKG